MPAEDTETDDTEDTGAYLNDAWRDWKSNCGKNWTDKAEEQRRRIRWEKNFRALEALNDGSPTYSVAQTCQMDMTTQEIRDSYFGLDKVPESTDESEDETADEDEAEYTHDQSLPDYVLWKNVIDLPVREQRCGDCWANAAITTLESLY